MPVSNQIASAKLAEDVVLKITSPITHRLIPLKITLRCLIASESIQQNNTAINMPIPLNEYNIPASVRDRLNSLD